MKGFRLSAREFFKFTAQDLRELTKAMRTEGKLSVLQISDGRNAVCKPGACTLIYEKNNRLEIQREDLAPMTSLMKWAQTFGKEERRGEGPLVLRCTMDQCAYDLYIADKKEGGLRDKASLQLQNNPDFFLEPIVQNLLKDAVSTPNP